MGYIGVTAQVLTIDPIFQRDIHVSTYLQPNKKRQNTTTVIWFLTLALTSFQTLYGY